MSRKPAVKGSLSERPNDISTRPVLSLAKTAAGLSLDRNVQPHAALSRTLAAPGSSKGPLFSMPKSTLATVRTNRQVLDNAMQMANGQSVGKLQPEPPKAASHAPRAQAPQAPRGAGVSCSTSMETDEAGLSVPPGLDIFGLRTVDGGDDFADDADGTGGGFWMPSASLPTPPRTAQAHEQPRAQGPKEFFDGYNLWYEWESRKAGKPFWHCKETGETRWEKPSLSAVQQADKRPSAGMSCGTDEPDSLLDGAFDENANRRAFLQALYEWRNGGGAPAAPAASAAAADTTAAPQGTPAAANGHSKQHQQQQHAAANPAIKNAGRHEAGFGTTLVPKPKPSKPTPELAELSDQRQHSHHAQAPAAPAARAPSAQPQRSKDGQWATAPTHAAPTPSPAAGSSSSHARPLSGHVTLRTGSTKAPQSATLHAAAGKGDVVLVRELLVARAHLTALDRFGATALHYAAGGGHAEVARLLLQHGASANACSTDGDTPLHAAAKRGDDATLCVLLEHGAAVDCCNSRGNTPQKLALMFGMARAAALLDTHTQTHTQTHASASDATQHAQHAARTSAHSPARAAAAAAAAAAAPAPVVRGVSGDTSDLAAGVGAVGQERVLQPRAWVGREEQEEGRGGVGAHSVACDDSGDEGGVEFVASSNNFVPYGAAASRSASAVSSHLIHAAARAAGESEDSDDDDYCSEEEEEAAAAAAAAISVGSVGEKGGAVAAVGQAADGEREAARALLEGLRIRAKQEAEVKVEEHFSRPGTARSQRELEDDGGQQE